MRRRGTKRRILCRFGSGFGRCGEICELGACVDARRTQHTSSGEFALLVTKANVSTATVRGVGSREAAAIGALHGMARSKKNGVAPPSGKEKKKGRKHTGGSIVVVEAGGGKGSAGKSGGKDSSTTKKKKSSTRTKKGEAGDDVAEDEGSVGGTAGAASRNTRDAVREEVMTQVHAVPSRAYSSFPGPDLPFSDNGVQHSSIARAAFDSSSFVGEDSTGTLGRLIINDLYTFLIVLRTCMCVLFSCAPLTRFLLMRC